MAARFRREYTGEFVITDIQMTNGRVKQQREWIPNSIVNEHVSPRAIVIAPNTLEKTIPLARLEKHKGGLRGSLRLQTYGTADIWERMRLDFYVSTSRKNIARLVEQGYHETTPVMTSGSICLEHAGKLYLIPYLPHLDDLALALYLAAFDDHREIFLMGYSLDTQGQTFNWVNDVNRVFQDYPETQFVILSSDAGLADVWRENANVSAMKPRKFISYCDL